MEFSKYLRVPSPNLHEKEKAQLSFSFVPFPPFSPYYREVQLDFIPEMEV